MKPKCYQLIGVPGAGKSTWIKNQPWADSCVVVSTDSHVEKYAKSAGKTYSQVFKNYMPKAIELMVAHAHLAANSGKDIIWDQTSLTRLSRLRKFKMLPNYEHIAVVFKTPDRVELNHRLASRPGKIIPKSVIQNMIKTFEPPSISEGFTKIWAVHN